MDFKRHWRNSEFGGIKLSLGNGLIIGHVFFTSLIQTGDNKKYQATVNDVPIGCFISQVEGQIAVEENITKRVLKMLNQVAYGIEAKE